MKTLLISHDLTLPLDAATQTFAMIGRKGSGKTYASGKLAELLIGVGVQTVILDLVGKWWGLRLAADGASLGIDIPMFGGLRGDIPLEATGGALIADTLSESGRSAILDISQFSKGDRQRFAFQFGERLWRLKKAEMNPTPIHLMIEESQLIVPENIPSSGKGEFLTQMYGMYEEIIRLGRNYGIGVTMISQRPQSVAKEVLNQAEPLLVFQLIGAHERKAVRDWMKHQGMDESLIDSLPSLSKGECWFWSPEWLGELRKIKIAKKWTFDSTATPKVGEKHVKARTIKPIDLEDLQEKMAATIERAKAEDPKELNKVIAGLRRDLATIQKNQQPREQDTKRIQELTEELTKARAATKTGPPKIVEKKIVIESNITRLEKHYEDAKVPLERLELLVERIHQERGHIKIAIDEAKELNAQNLQVVAPPPVSSIRARQTEGYVPSRNVSVLKRELSAPAAVATSNGDFKLSKKQQEILNALAWYESIGIVEPSTLQVGAIALIDASGGHFSNTVGPLSSQGLVNRGSGTMSLTDQGRVLAVVPEHVGSLADYHEVLRSRVRRARSAGGKTIDILNVIISHGGSEVSTETIGKEAGIDHTGGHFSNMIGPLSTVGLIERRSGIVRPTQVLFPPGLS